MLTTIKFVAACTMPPSAPLATTSIMSTTMNVLWSSEWLAYTGNEVRNLILCILRASHNLVHKLGKFVHIQDTLGAVKRVLQYANARSQEI
jgi:hypothetical protein